MKAQHRQATRTLAQAVRTIHQQLNVAALLAGQEDILMKALLLLEAGQVATLTLHQDQDRTEHAILLSVSKFESI